MRGRIQDEWRLSGGFALILAGLMLYAAPQGLAVERATGGGYLLQTWSSEDGLVAGNIYALERTLDGFLWLGTDLGLIRFDGERFRRLESQEFPLGSGDRVSCLLVDAQGALWAGTERGHLAQGARGVFCEVKLPAQAGDRELSALAEGRDGSLWIATLGAGLLHYSGGAWHVFGTTNGLPSNDVQSIVCDADDRLWALCAGRLVFREGERWHAPTPALPSAQSVSSIGAGADGSLWVATTVEANFRGARLFRLAEGHWGEALAPYPWPQDSARSAIKALREDRLGRLWVSTSGGGVFRRDPAGEWQSLQQGPLAHEVVNALLLDREGALWFGLQGGQLFQACPQAVTAFRLAVREEQNIVQSVCVRQDGAVWAGTYGSGVFCLRDGRWTSYGRQQGLTNLYVFSVFEDSHKTLWAGTRTGLFRLAGDRFEFCPELLTQLAIVSVFESRDGALWMGGSRGLRQLKGGKLRVFGTNEGVNIREDGSALAEDSAGHLWLGARRGGLFRQVSDERFEQYRAPLWNNGVEIRAMRFDGEGALWLATFGQGLFRIKDDQVRRWTLRDGLPSSYCVGLAQDADGRFWISTLNGIFGCTPQTLLTYEPGRSAPPFGRHLSAAEGLDGATCSGWGQPVVGRGADGRLWFPNQRSVAVFDPVVVMKHGSKWPVIIEEARVDGVPAPIGPEGKVRIGSGARQIEFHYTLPNLLAPGRLRFRYRLAGLEEDWVDAQQRRAAYYSHLRPGHYRFSVMACGPEGDWQESQQTLELEVVPRLWERTSIRVAGATLTLAAVGAIMWTVSRVRMRARLLRLEAQQMAERERRRIARDLHDELGSGLTEIMLLGDWGSQAEAFATEARGNAQAIAQKARQLASGLDEVVWTTNPTNDALPKLTSYLCDYAHEFLRGAPVRCRLEVGDMPEETYLGANVRHNLFLAFKEALHNAIRHSGAEEIRIRMRAESGRLRVEIADNGCGFELPARSSQGNGLQNMRERLESVGGRFAVDSRPNQGTTVRFEMDLPAG
jgi:ligand-binding sensor domain-containing protein/signal transduction histidine kinase